MKEFAATIKLHNNLLRERREMLGLSAPQVAKKMGVHYQTYVRFENLHESPVSTKGGRPPKSGERVIEWRPAAIKIAEFYGVGPEELWPDTVLAVRKRAAEVKLSAQQAVALAGGVDEIAALPEDAEPDELLGRYETALAIRKALKKLSPREERAILARYGLIDGEEKTLDEVAELDGRGCSRERARQLVGDAIRKLRRRDHGLIEHAPEGEDVLEERRAKALEQAQQESEAPKLEDRTREHVERDAKREYMRGVIPARPEDQAAYNEELQRWQQHRQGGEAEC